MTHARSVPFAPKSIPLLGHLVSLLREPLTFLASLSEHGDVVRIRVGPFPLVVICDPELTRRALLDDRAFDKGGLLYDRAREALGTGLLSCPHGEHRRLRRLAQPAFHPDRLTGYAQAMTSRIEEVTEAWRSGEILDMPTEMLTLASKVTTTTLFSGVLSAEQSDQILGDVDTVVKGVFQRMFLVPPLDRLPTQRNRAYALAHTRMRETCNQFIAERRAQNVDHGDLLDALITAHDPETGGAGMTDAEISDTIATFFLAGTETTASLLMWALDLLARHPRIEERLHEEVDAVLRGAAATSADLPRLQLTKQVLTETLRLRPPVWLTTRTVTSETRLGGYVLPAGTNVAYSPYLVHHRADLFERPETFDPDRWDPARPQPPRHALIPFATGARKCIGDTFAMTEATLALATIAARWRLEHPSGQREVRPALGATLRPRELRMRATARTAPRAALVS